MNLSIVGRHIELTEPIKNYIQGAFESLDKYNLDIISISAVADAGEKKGKKGVSIEFAINLAKKGTVVVKQRDKDLYAAIDIAIERAQKVLRRHHDKVVDHQKTSLEEVTATQVAQEALDNGSEDEIVPMDLELHKPIEIEEALNSLKESNQQFMVFNDHDGKTRVLYKRNDSKYGLY